VVGSRHRPGGGEVEAAGKVVGDHRGGSGQLLVVVVGPGNDWSGPSMWRRSTIDEVEGGRRLRGSLRPGGLA
jgi:hypothetical protein